MATRTAKGTATLKASGTTLTLASVSATAGDAMIVMIGNQTQNIPTTVKWGNKDLTKSAHAINTTGGAVASVWIGRNIVNTDTRNIVVTWSTAIGARALAAAILDSGHIRDQSATSTQTASTAPSVGPTAALATVNDFAFGVLVSIGPSSDTAPTLAAGWTAGQRAGTVGVPPVSNITILEGYQQLTAFSAITLSGTGATARDWASVVVAYRPIGELIAVDSEGTELLVGDTVDYEGTESTISSFTKETGIPSIVANLANGESVTSYLLTLVK